MRIGYAKVSTKNKLQIDKLNLYSKWKMFFFNKLLHGNLGKILDRKIKNLKDENLINIIKEMTDYDANGKWRRC